MDRCDQNMKNKICSHQEVEGPPSRLEEGIWSENEQNY